MKIDFLTPDAAVLEELGRRLSRHRLNRNQSQAEVAREAGVSLRTLVRMEQGQPSTLINLIRVLRALDLLDNVEALVPAQGPSPLQMLGLEGRERRRASGADAADEEPTEPWHWGDDQEDES